MILFLIDVAFLVREGHHKLLSFMTITSAFVVLLDVTVLWKTAQITTQEKPDPTFRVAED